MDEKGHVFRGIVGGAGYRRLAALFGMGDRYYRSAVGDIPLPGPIRALDLGCGPGAMCFTLAEKVRPGSEIHGVDLSADQLSYAAARAKEFPSAIHFRLCSMDALEFPDGHFNLVMTSMALHVTPPGVRRATIRETARVLKTGGRFILVDWSRPRFGILGAVWLPFLVFGENNKDNWNNTYRRLCEAEGMELECDDYISAIARRQVFVKKEAIGGR